MLLSKKVSVLQLGGRRGRNDRTYKYFWKVVHEELCRIAQYDLSTPQALIVDCSFDTTLPTLSEKLMSFHKIVEWAIPGMPPLDWEQKLAFDFLELCMELNPQKRFSAADALQHPFLCAAEEDEGLEDVFLP